ncbi:hypothetical protein CF65_00235 [Aggregatibacter actinomycetemcomitans HK1651]|nr:hypothetical protein CF65_00235 [Aggregatibacter actinomycetemcomitans HK1651]
MRWKNNVFLHRTFLFSPSHFSPNEIPNETNH